MCINHLTLFPFLPVSRAHRRRVEPFVPNSLLSLERDYYCVFAHAFAPEMFDSPFSRECGFSINRRPTSKAYPVFWRSHCRKCTISTFPPQIWKKLSIPGIRWGKPCSPSPVCSSAQYPPMSLCFCFLRRWQGSRYFGDGHAFRPGITAASR